MQQISTIDDKVSMLPPEFLDVVKVLEFGAVKYGAGSFLIANNPSMAHKKNHDSMFHHLAESFAAPGATDPESDLDPLLHLACRALMMYTRKQRGIVHEED